MKHLLTDSALSKQSGSLSQEKGQEIVVFPDEMDRNSHLDPKRLNANFKLVFTTGLLSF